MKLKSEFDVPDGGELVTIVFHLLVGRVVLFFFLVLDEFGILEVLSKLFEFLELSFLLDRFFGAIEFILYPLIDSLNMLSVLLENTFEEEILKLARLVNLNFIDVLEDGIRVFSTLNLSHEL